MVDMWSSDKFREEDAEKKKGGAEGGTEGRREGNNFRDTKGGGGEIEREKK
jgi:hypothetical protein